MQRCGPDLRLQRLPFLGFNGTVGSMSETDSSAIDEYVRRVVAEAPPFTAEQRSKLRTLLADVTPGSSTDESSDS